MRIRHLILGLLLLATGGTFAQNRPNVILILTDDQGYGDLGSQGNPFIETPHLDRFYTESVRLTDFHVDPVCTPTRAALLTGRYSIRTGAWRTGAGRAFLRRDEVTLADVFAVGGLSHRHVREVAPGRQLPLSAARPWIPGDGVAPPWRHRDVR